MASEVKVILVGDENCGKTNLLFRLCKGHFPESQRDDSSFETEATVLSVQGQKVELMMCDTGGGTMFDCLRKLSYESGDVILLCYSITDRKSFENILEKWKPEVEQNTTSARPILLVGTKKDARDPDMTFRDIRHESDRSDTALSAFEGRELENRVSAVDFIECSAKTGENVTEVFQRAAEIGLRHVKEKKKKTCLPS